MAPRASSPALSENEFDIGAALFGDDDNVGQKNGASADLGLDLAIGNDDGSDDEAFIAATQAASNRKGTNLKGKTVKKGGGFQAMGLNAALLKAITGKGFKVPTPIQRKAVPLILDRQDVVGMARTGSGKTAAFVIPMIQALKTHSAKVGARAIVLSPSRELALQTLKVVKELGRGTDLRTVLVVGGDSLDEQFNSMTSNPDIVIATPGRFLHLKVEMNLDLSSVRYIVFDEADRLFEMGFAAQLAEIMVALPTSRQTLLFSATLPKTLVEFARAGLQEPKLIRLDDSKVSPDLESAFFMLKSGERDAALLYLLDQVIKIPMGETEAAKRAKEPSNSKKRKRDDSNPKDAPTPNSTVVFAATKHRVEYLASLLKTAGYSVSYVYGNLDQTARKGQVLDFRAGLTNILVVTDVAARGLDLPYLANVVNYDFPSQPKIFVHRVGRTARAGRKGWSYSLIRDSDVPYLIDLQLFLGKRLLCGRQPGKERPNFAQDVIVGSFIADELEPMVERVQGLHGKEEDLVDLRAVAGKGEAQYIRTRNSASSQSVRRAKELLASRSLSGTHALFGDEVHDVLRAKEKMLETISSFRPTESIFEVGNRGTGDIAAEIMRKRREQIERMKEKQARQSANTSADVEDGVSQPKHADDDLGLRSDDADDMDDPDSASESDELEISVSHPTSGKSGKDEFENSEFFMSYEPKGINVAEDKGYGVHSGSYNTAQQSSNFIESARAAQMDLTNDETRGFGEASKRGAGLRWDKKSKKYVARANDVDGSKGAKMVRGESGLKIAASFRSGRFQEWRKTNKVGRLPRVGDLEKGGSNHTGGPNSNGKHYKHKAEKAPKEADRFRDDYFVQKKRVQEAKENRIGKFKDGGGKSELKGADDVRKQRQLEQKRQEKNARPSKKRKT